MRVATIVAPSILGIAIAAWPGAALAAQVVGIALAVAPAFGLALRAATGRSRGLAARRASSAEDRRSGA
jgi:hypothetical protein